MNEARKAIIELIEKYMDKTLSTFCLVELLETKESENAKGTKGHIEYIGSPIWYAFNWKGSYKILGHYDITAVLKYVKNKIIRIDEDDYLQTTTDDSYIEFEYFEPGDNIPHSTQFISIPNKPLHLYTEQEEKDLLNLLNKLN